MRYLENLVRLLGVLIFMSSVSCKSTAKDSAPRSEVSASPVTPEGFPAAMGPAIDCRCGDMECWRRATNDGMVDQIRCAKDAMEKVVPIVGPIMDLAFNLAEAQNEIKALSDLDVLAQQIIAANANQTGFPKELSCVLEIAVAFNGALSPLKNLNRAAQVFSENPSLVHGKAMTDLLKHSYDGAMAFSRLAGNASVACKIDPTKKEWKKYHETLTKLTTKPRAFFDSFVTRAKDLTKGRLDQLNVAYTIYACGQRIFKGARTLYRNSACLVDDLKALEDGKKAVARSLAYEGTRQFNHAKYVGCTQCVNSSYGDSTETEYRNCRRRCDEQARFLDGRPYQKASWVTSCQLTCGTARTDGIFRDYTDEETCKEVKGMFPVSRKFRIINIADEAKRGGERAKSAGQMRHLVLAAIKQLTDAFPRLSGLHKSPGTDGHLQVEDLALCRDDVGLEQDLRDACGLFTAFVEGGAPYYYYLADTAGEGESPDGLVSAADLSYLRDEIAEYRDESEFDQPDLEAWGNGCAEWGRAEAIAQGSACKAASLMTSRCIAHQNHHIQVDPAKAPARGQCYLPCVRAWQDACLN